MGIQRSEAALYTHTRPSWTNQTIAIIRSRLIVSKSKQSKRTKQPATEESRPIMTVPGMLSAGVVIIIFIALGIMLANRSSGSLATEQPDSIATEAAQAQLASNAGQADDDPHNQDMTDDSHSDTTADSDTTTDLESVDTAEDMADTNASPPQQYSTPPPMTIDPAKTYIATITTPRGDIVTRLFPDLAPQTVNNFVFLAREGFYDGLTWHRVIDGFMAQGGDPTGTGMGGPGYSIPAEFTDEILFDTPGMLAMARSADPDSAGSQFFITTGAAPWLNGQYTLFGEVIEGQEVVNGIPLRDPEIATEPGEPILRVTIDEQSAEQ